MSTISLRLNDSEADLIRKYADMHGVSISDLVRQTVLDRIEDEYDLAAYREAAEEYRRNPVSFSHADVVKMLGDD